MGVMAPSGPAAWGPGCVTTNQGERKAKLTSYDEACKWLKDIERIKRNLGRVISSEKLEVPKIFNNGSLIK